MCKSPTNVTLILQSGLGVNAPSYHTVNTRGSRHHHNLPSPQPARARAAGRRPQGTVGVQARELSMNLKSKAVAAAAAAVLVSGVTAVAAMSAGAAHPVVRGVVRRSLQPRVRHAQDPRTTWPTCCVRAPRPGQPIILFRTSNTDPAEDISAEFSGLASEFFAAGMLSPAAALHTAACRAARTSPGRAGRSPAGRRASMTRVRGRVRALRRGQRPVAWAWRPPRSRARACPCSRAGRDARTVWIVDLNDSPSTLGSGYVPLINGSDTNFSIRSC